MNLLPATWETDRLLIQQSAVTEIGRLRDVFNACSYVGQWDKTFQLVSEEEMAGLVNQGLEENGRFHMKTVRQKETGNIIAYFHLTHGTPKAHLVWISMFVVHPAYQKHHFGQEITSSLWQHIKQLGEYSAVWLDVYLKNWPAFRFWLNNGFNTIIDYEGDPTCTAESYANIVLEKKLL
jgi:ribosomal protein S18 acetylase RimI-like enzyme